MEPVSLMFIFGCTPALTHLVTVYMHIINIYMYFRTQVK